MGKRQPDGVPVLKIGLLVDSMIQPRWVRRVVESIQASSCARVTLVVENGARATARPSRVKRLVRNRRHLLYGLYTRLDDWLFRSECQPDAFERVSIEDLIPTVERLVVTPRQTTYSDYIEGVDLQRIAAAGLDVALRFGFRILRGDILRTPRYGVWSYHHGDNHRYRGAPAGFWEVMRGDDVTGSILQVLGSDLDNGVILYRSYAPTDKRSVRRNKNNYYWKSAEFVIRRLRDLAVDGEALIESAARQPYAPYSSPLYRVPTNGELVRLLPSLFGRMFRDKLTHVWRREQWRIAYTLEPPAAGDSPAPFRFRELVPPPDRFWADPFLVSAGGEHYIFFEELIDGITHANRRKAHISVVRVGPRGAIGEPRVALSTDCHLSYPYVFEWRGTYFMVPESAGHRRVDLYRCVTFPDGWAFECTLLDGVSAVDPTLFEHGGLWWLFVGLAAEGARNVDELHLYYAPNPMGPWTPHRRNPVKSDVRSARPAGQLFWHGSDLYRPAQDCSQRYGFAVTLNRVTRLDRDEYEETEVSRLTPEWQRGIVGTHTLNRASCGTVVDALVRVPRWRLR